MLSTLETHCAQRIESNHNSAPNTLSVTTKTTTTTTRDAPLSSEKKGIYGESEVRTVDLATGAVRARRRLAPQYFGEGLARLNGTLFQLTWQGPAGFSWAADDSLAPRGTFRTPLSDGWGAAADGALVVLSDGSSTLTWADPARGWARVRSLPVRLGARPVANLNELEVVNGEVWANVWYTDCVARICPQTGQITGWLLLSGLRKPGWGADADVLNGVAWDAASGRLFVTGKRWPRLYELRLTRLDANSAANKAAAAACSRPPQFEG